MDKFHRIAYSIADRGGRSYWTRVGVTMLNKDGSETVLLDALPLGRLVLQEAKKVQDAIEENQ